MSKDDNNLSHKPKQALVRAATGSLASRGLELAKKTEIEQVQGYRCVCWGLNEFGQCDVPDGEAFTQVSAGHRYSIGLREDGTAIAWGLDGRWGEYNEGDWFLATYVAADAAHLRPDGTTIAWRMNDRGQCDVPAGERFTQISAGPYYSIGLRADGAAIVWGNGIDDSFSPPPAPAGLRFTQVATGTAHSIGLVID